MKLRTFLLGVIVAALFGVWLTSAASADPAGLCGHYINSAGTESRDPAGTGAITHGRHHQPRPPVARMAPGVQANTRTIREPAPIMAVRSDTARRAPGKSASPRSRGIGSRGFSFPCWP